MDISTAEYFLIIVLSVLGIGVFYMLFLTFGLISLRPLPGPKGIPLIGNLLQVNCSERPHLQLSQWAYEFDAVYGFKILGKRILVLNSQDAILEASARRELDYSGIHGFWRMAFGCSTLSRKLKSQNKDLTRCTTFTMNGLHTSMKETLEYLVEDLSGTPRNTFDPLIALNTFSARSLITMVYGEDLVGLQYEKLVESLVGRGDGRRQDSSFLENNLDCFPGIPVLGNLVGVQKLIKSLHYQVLANKKVDERCLLGLLNKECGNLWRGNDDVLDTVTDFIIRGSKLLSSTLYTQILLLASHQTVQNKIHVELNQFFNKGSKLNLQLHELPYTRAAIEETLRYSPPLPLGPSVCTKKKTTMQGYFIPRSTITIYNLWHVNHDSNIWGDPWIYRPDRFLTDSGMVVETDQRRSVTLDVGQNSIFTEELLKKQVLFAISRLLKEFFILPGDGQWVGNPDPRMFDLRHTLMPTSYQIKLQPRAMS